MKLLESVLQRRFYSPALTLTPHPTSFSSVPFQGKEGIPYPLQEDSMRCLYDFYIYQLQEEIYYLTGQISDEEVKTTSNHSNDKLSPLAGLNARKRYIHF